jgi:hypothetical protein
MSVTLRGTNGIGRGPRTIQEAGVPSPFVTSGIELRPLIEKLRKIDNVMQAPKRADDLLHQNDTTSAGQLINGETPLVEIISIAGNENTA